MLLNTYLEILKKVSLTDHPFQELPDSERLGEAVTALTHSLAEFVEAAIAHPELTYQDALDNLEDMVHYFPKPDPAGAALVAALEGMYAAIADDAPDTAEAPETTSTDSK